MYVYQQINLVSYLVVMGGVTHQGTMQSIAATRSWTWKKNDGQLVQVRCYLKN